MRISWRAAVCALLAAAMCGGCSTSAKEVYQTSVMLAKVLHMQVNETNTALHTQAEKFAARVQKLSGGSLRIEVTGGYPDHETVASGTADLAFLSNIQMAQASESFATLSLPFLYDNAEHMSVALNSQEVLDRLARELAETNLLPMMAVYNGTACLVTTRGELRIPADFQGLVLAMRTDNAEKIRMFETLGARVLPFSQTSLVPLFGTQTEILPDDLRMPDETVTIEAIEADPEELLGLLADAPSLYLLRTFHNLSPLWLTANAQTFQDLSTREQAILREGMAGLLAELELSQQARDVELLGQLTDAGMTVVDIERPEIGVAIYGATGAGTEKYQPPEIFDPRLYQLIQNYS